MGPATREGEAPAEPDPSRDEPLEAAPGPDAARQVGTLLAYTTDEWDLDLPAKAG